MYTPTVIEMMILEFLSGTNNDRIHYNGIKSSAFFSVIYESEFIRDVPNGEGCAKDRDKAKYHLANDIDHLLDLIETKVPQKNVFVVFASGGGTGSGISPYLLNILVEKFSTDEDGELSANPAKLFSAITILPSDSEPLQPAINSYSCCKEILDIENLGTVFFIDNNSMEDKMKINKVFVNELDTVLSIPTLHKSVKGNVDKAEIKKVIFETHGMGKILCRPRERGTAECIIHDLKDKSIYAPALSKLSMKRSSSWSNLKDLLPGYNQLMMRLRSA